MKKFAFLICGDDGAYELADDLGHAHWNIIVNYLVQHSVPPEDSFVDEVLENMGISCYRFTLPEDAHANAHFAPANVRATLATIIGRGIAFSDGWSADGSISFLVEV